LNRSDRAVPLVKLAAMPLTHPVAADLVVAAEADLNARYRDGSIGHLCSREFGPESGGLFVVAWSDDTPVGCGGYRRLDEEAAELKRVYVAPAGRRRGIAMAVLDYLQQQASEAGYRRVWLETGTLQPESIALYRAAGYQSIGCFGEHGSHPQSLYFGLELSLPQTLIR
jgi:GNAT superfamily N-acetyltransferase